MVTRESSVVSPKTARTDIRQDDPRVESSSYVRLRIAFWLLGTVLAIGQAWISRYFITADAISYMDMSDGMLRGQDWHRLINPVWDPLYPALLGLFRRLLAPSATHEIAFDHGLNVLFFVLAFAAFEFLLISIDRQFLASNSERTPLPRWAILILAYSLFIWSSISAITLESLRPDMLMSAFLYLAVALMIRMRGKAASLRAYAGLGVVLGVSYLAKVPMLPIGLILIGSSVFLVKGRRRAMALAAGSVAIVLLIGSVYFVPLSKRLGRFSLGDSGRFNYILWGNHLSPGRYLTDQGIANGTPVHRVRQIFPEPLAYEFSIGRRVTDPLRFDPSYWAQGLKPRITLRNQVITTLATLPAYRDVLIEQAGMIVGFLLLCYLVGWSANLLQGLLEGWPLWLVGMAGILMYAPVHAEPRYLGAFFVLFWLGLLAGVRYRRATRNLVAGIVLGIALTLGLVSLSTIYLQRRYRWNARQNIDAEVVRELSSFGIQAGDPVARISTATDLGWARAARVTIVAETDMDTGSEVFWKSSPAVQSEVLRAFREAGARCVVAHAWLDVTASGWYRVGSSHYWIYPLK